MKFQMPLIAVQDVKRSIAFYTGLFEQKVVMDFGKNVTFHGGFAIQEDFPWLTGLSSEQVTMRPNNMELYFEVEDFDSFLERLKLYPDIELLHPTRTYEWYQRVIRLYDPDGHLIEVGESMVTIVKRFLAEGKSVEETAELTQHPVAFVRSCQ